MKYIDAEEIEKRIHEIIDTNLNGVSPEINRRAATLFPVSCINDDGRPFDVNYTRQRSRYYHHSPAGAARGGFRGGNKKIWGRENECRPEIVFLGKYCPPLLRTWA